LTLSSSLEENKSFTTAIIKNIAAIAIKKFLILNAIAVNAPRIPSLQ